MTKHVQIYALFLICILYTSCGGQNKTDLPKDYIKSESKDVISSHGPKWITRTIKQDIKGNIWIAAFDGVFRYDGKSFTNITGKVSSSRFFSVLEDKKGNFWFASIGSGVYYYDGISFLNFTTREGLANDQVTDIYEDKAGNIWFGTEGGVSRYDGSSFQNFTTKEGLPHNEVNSIIEDKSGKLWFGTKDGACSYDGEIFTNFTNYGKPFNNVRSIIEDKKGNIWLGGNDGLWRYDGSTFTNFTQRFLGYIYEDKKGNIWTSSESANDQGWALSRYDEKSLSNKNTFVTDILPNSKPTATEIISQEGMIFGILEDYDGNIWFGTLNGVYGYDGNTFHDFEGKEARE